MNKAFLATATVTAAAAALIPATTAGAQSPTIMRPASATGCASNVCIYVAGNAGGTVLVQAWARNTSFNGYFTLNAPSSINRNSPTQTWQGQKGNYWSTSVSNAPGGTYCITGNPGQGTACEHVS